MQSDYEYSDEDDIDYTDEDEMMDVQEDDGEWHGGLLRPPTYVTTGSASSDDDMDMDGVVGEVEDRPRRIKRLKTRIHSWFGAPKKEN